MLVLRMAFLLPALVDFVLSVLTLLRMGGVSDDSLLPRAQFAAVAFFWSLLLVVGLWKPVERSWILRPTALVIGGIGAAYLFAFWNGVIPLGTMALAVTLALALIALCWIGWTRGASFARAV